MVDPWQLHREGNQPAFICASEPQTYCRQGVPYQIQLKDFHRPQVFQSLWLELLVGSVRF